MEKAYEIQLTKKQNGPKKIENEKSSTLPKERSHIPWDVTDPFGKSVEETGDELNTTKSKYNNNKQNTVIFYQKWKKYNEIQLTTKKRTRTIKKIKIIHPPRFYG